LCNKYNNVNTMRDSARLTSPLNHQLPHLWRVFTQTRSRINYKYNARFRRSYWHHMAPARPGWQGDPWSAASVATPQQSWDEVSASPWRPTPPCRLWLGWRPWARYPCSTRNEGMHCNENSFSGHCAASVPISICRWAISIFPGSVHVFPAAE
jgi:hypothetical protein